MNFKVVLGYLSNFQLGIKARFIITLTKEGKKETAVLYASGAHSHIEVAGDFGLDQSLILGGGDIGLLPGDRTTVEVGGESMKFGAVPKVVLEKFQKPLLAEIKKNFRKVKNLSINLRILVSGDDPKWQKLLKG